jgi:hypothetical protein
MEITANDLLTHLTSNVYLTFVIILLLLWIKFEPSIKNLFSFIRYDLIGKDKIEIEKEKNAFEIRTEMFMDRISAKIVKIASLALSPDMGRNLLYHYLIKSMLVLLRDNFENDLKDFREGKLSREKFCSYHDYHRQSIESFKNKYIAEVKAKLIDEGWSEDDINYVINIYLQWSFSQFEMLAELLASSKTPEEIIMAWWIFFYEFYSTLEKFSILINGKITGRLFEGVKLGKPRKPKQVHIEI